MNRSSGAAGPRWSRQARPSRCRSTPLRDLRPRAHHRGPARRAGQVLVVDQHHLAVGVPYVAGEPLTAPRGVQADDHVAAERARGERHRHLGGVPEQRAHVGRSLRVDEVDGARQPGGGRVDVLPPGPVVVAVPEGDAVVVARAAAAARGPWGFEETHFVRTSTTGRWPTRARWRAPVRRRGPGRWCRRGRARAAWRRCRSGGRRRRGRCRRRRGRAPWCGRRCGRCRRRQLGGGHLEVGGQSFAQPPGGLPQGQARRPARRCSRSPAAATPPGRCRSARPNCSRVRAYSAVSCERALDDAELEGAQADDQPLAQPVHDLRPRPGRPSTRSSPSRTSSSSMRATWSPSLTVCPETVTPVVVGPHQEDRDAVGAVGRYDEEVGDRAGRHRGLHAGDGPAVVRPRGGGGRSVGHERAVLADSSGQHAAAGGGVGQPPLTLRVVAELRDRQRSGAVPGKREWRHHAAGLDDHAAQLEQPQPAAADVLRQREAEQPGVAELVPQLLVEAGAALLDLARAAPGCSGRRGSASRARRRPAARRWG